MLEATARLQRSVLGEFRNGKRTGGVALAASDTLPADSRQAARHCLEQYLAEFPALCLEARPQHQAWRDPKRKWFRGNRPAAEIGREYHATWFRVVPAGKFWMGNEGYSDEPVHIGERKTPMHVAQFPVTNELLAMYAPRHTEPFEDYKSFSGAARCPAIYVNWYDAWCVAAWLHARLPDEYEWEGACRAQFWQDPTPPPRATTYWFGDSEAKLGQHAMRPASVVGPCQPGPARLLLCPSFPAVTTSYSRLDREIFAGELDVVCGADFRLGVGRRSGWGWPRERSPAARLRSRGRAGPPQPPANSGETGGETGPPTAPNPNPSRARPKWRQAFAADGPRGGDGWPPPETRPPVAAVPTSRRSPVGVPHRPAVRPGERND